MTIFIVTGRLGSSLVLSKVLPIVQSKLYDRVFVFGNRIQNYQGVCFIAVPKILSKQNMVCRATRIIYESFQILFYAIFYKPKIIFGIYLLPKGLNSYITGRLTGTKVAVNIIGGVGEIEQRYLIFWRLWRLVNLYLIKHSDIVLVKGEKDKNYIKNNVDILPAKLFTYNGAIDTDRFYYDIKISKDIDILFVGRFYYIKGPLRFVEIIKIIREKFPNISSVMLGDGPSMTLTKELITRYELDENIKLKNHVLKPEEYYKRAKILLMPSTTEGLSTAMLEAMACACVPIVSDVGNQSEAAIDGHNSLLVGNYNDVSSFALRAIEVLNDDENRTRLLVNGVNLVKNKYSINSQAEIIKKVFSF
jgi:glycosyltransferase involved in cell wall biosynthesis